MMVNASPRRGARNSLPLHGVDAACWQMKQRIVWALFAQLVCAAFALAADATWRPLFNGKDLAGWETYLSVPLSTSEVPGAERDAKGNYTKLLGLGNDPLKCFSVVDVDGRPAIRLSGEGYGALTTLESFSNYHLRLQFKWGTKKWLHDTPPGLLSSGLLYHGHGNHGDADAGKRWLFTHQFQIQEGNCGDYIVMGDTAVDITARKVSDKKYAYDDKAAKMMFCAKTPNQSRCSKAGAFENPTSEWVTLELICVGDTAIHVVNGHVVLRLTGSRKAVGDGYEPLTGGRLELQMEGSEIYFRDIEIKPVTEIPAQFAEH